MHNRGGYTPRGGPRGGPQGGWRQGEGGYGLPHPDDRWGQPGYGRTEMGYRAPHSDRDWTGGGMWNNQTMSTPHHNRGNRSNWRSKGSTYKNQGRGDRETGTKTKVSMPVVETVQRTQPVTPETATEEAAEGGQSKAYNEEGKYLWDYPETKQDQERLSKVLAYFVNDVSLRIGDDTMAQMFANINNKVDASSGVSRNSVPGASGPVRRENNPDDSNSQKGKLDEATGGAQAGDTANTNEQREGAVTAKASQPDNFMYRLNFFAKARTGGGDPPQGSSAQDMTTPQRTHARDRESVSSNIPAETDSQRERRQALDNARQTIVTQEDECKEVWENIKAGNYEKELALNHIQNLFRKYNGTRIGREEAEGHYLYILKDEQEDGKQPEEKGIVDSLQRQAFEDQNQVTKATAQR